jgi:hypothetical protein
MVENAVKTSMTNILRRSEQFAVRMSMSRGRHSTDEPQNSQQEFFE